MNYFKEGEFYRYKNGLSYNFIQIIGISKSGKSVKFKNANSTNTLTARIKTDEQGNQYFLFKTPWWEYKINSNIQPEIINVIEEDEE